MRVLHVTSGLDPRSGGPAVALAGLVRAQHAAGINVSILETFPAGAHRNVSEQLRAQGIPIHAVGPTRGPLDRHPDLPRTVLEAVGQSDIVHIHAVWEEVQHHAARAAQARNIPYIIRPCGMLDPHTLGQKWLKKRLYLAWRLRRNLDRAAAIHFTSEIERNLTGALGIRAPAIVEPNGVDLSEFESMPGRGTFRKQWGIPLDRKLVLFLGRLHEIKGLELLVPAFARVVRAGETNATLVLAGPGSDEYGRQIRALAQSEQVQDRVIFTGMLDGRQRVEAYADADLYALTSRHENFGVAVIEALAAGCPVLISDQVSIHPELSRAGVAGVAPLQVDRIAAELAAWLADEPRRRMAGARGRALVREQYDWRRIALRWRERYGEMTGFTPSTRGGGCNAPAPPA